VKLGNLTRHLFGASVQGLATLSVPAGEQRLKAKARKAPHWLVVSGDANKGSAMILVTASAGWAGRLSSRSLPDAQSVSNPAGPADAADRGVSHSPLPSIGASARQ